MKQRLDKKEFLINCMSYLGSILYYPIRTRRKKTFNINKVKRILIVAYRHGIGTFVLITPLLRTLKKNIAECEITLLIDSEVVSELAGNCQYIDKIINREGLSTSNLLNGIKYFRTEIAPHKYDLVISTIYERTSRNSFWTYFTGAPYRISFEKRISGFLDTHSFEWDKDIHEVKNYLRLLVNIGCTQIYDDLKLELSAESIEYADHFLRINNISSKDVILGIHPGAKKDWFQKRWPLKRFIEVADEFCSEFGAKIIFFGGPDEKEIISELINHNSNFTLANNQNIRHTQALIKRCSLFLSNDSGLMHIAAIYQIPIVAIFGPTNPLKNSPWKAPHEIVKSTMKCSPCYDYSTINCKKNECIESIPSGQVFQALKEHYNEVIKR